VNKGANKKVKVQCSPSEAGRVLGRLSYPARIEKLGEAAVLNTACKNLEKAREKRWAD
jgi:hypothetical protein